MIYFCRQLLAALIIAALVFPAASESKAISASRATDTYDYDAFGNLIHSTGTTPNNYLYSGEQFDPDLGLYYNRARYLNISTGRFWSMDTSEGDDESPLSLHRYLYANSDPVNGRDPSGHEDLAELGTVQGVIGTINSMTSAVSTAMRAYNFASDVASIADYLPLAVDLMQAFGQPTPALVESAVISAVEKKFGPVGVSKLTGGLSRALRTLAPSWGQIANAIERAAPGMASLIAPEVARRMSTYLAAQAENRLKLVFFMPTGPGPRSGDIPVSAGPRAEVDFAFTGGRLFGLGLRTSAGYVDQVFRLDYWDPHIDPIEPLQVHYHIYSDQDFPPGKIWP